MPRRGDEVGYIDPETMKWVTTGVVSNPETNFKEAEHGEGQRPNGPKDRQEAPQIG